MPVNGQCLRYGVNRMVETWKTAPCETVSECKRWCFLLSLQSRWLRWMSLLIRGCARCGLCEFTSAGWTSQNTFARFYNLDMWSKLALFGSQRRWSLSLLVLTLIFPALLPCLVRDSLCTALQTKRLLQSTPGVQCS